MDFQFGEKMNNFSVQNNQGELLEELPKTEKYLLVFYLSDACGSCIDVVKGFNRIESVLGTDEINYILLWTNKIPEKMLDKYNVNKDYCYSLNGEMKFATSTPSFFILDENKKVVFSTTNLNLLIGKLAMLRIIPQEKLKQNAIAYINENILDTSTQERHIVYFEMAGCSDCEAANKIIESEIISSRFSVTKIYKYDDKEPSRLKDDFGLFRMAFEINWYPSFLIIEKDEARFIGETPIEKLQDSIMVVE